MAAALDTFRRAMQARRPFAAPIDKRALLAALLAQVDAAATRAPKDDSRARMVTIAAGPSRFRVLGTRDRLAEFRRQLERCPGFKAETYATSSMGAGMRAWRKAGLRGSPIERHPSEAAPRAASHQSTAEARA